MRELRRSWPWSRRWKALAKSLRIHNRLSGGLYMRAHMKNLGLSVERQLWAQRAQLWKALAKRQLARHRLSILLLGIQIDGHIEAYAKAKADLTDNEVELGHLRAQVRRAVKLLERDLEFGERSAYVEEALEALR